MEGTLQEKERETMKKPFRDTEWWKLIRTVLQMIGIAALMWLMIEAARWAVTEVHAEDRTMWAICQPDDVLIVRDGPKKGFAATGELKPGTAVTTDGKKRNGYLHLVDMANESGTGWVRSIYLVDEEPETVNRTATVISKGRLAARRCIGGERVRWLKPGQTVTVYYRTSEWCVTDKGYVVTRYLRVDGE